MRHHNELRTLRVFLQIIRVIPDIRVIQRGFNLVQNAERRGLQFQHREQNRNRRQRAFPAGKQRQELQFLSRRLGVDLDAAVQRVVRIHQLQFRVTAAEQPRERLGEIPLHLREVLDECRPHLNQQPLNEFAQVHFRALQVLLLGGQVVHTRLGFGVFLHRPDVDRSQRANLPLQLGGAAVAFLLVEGRAAELLCPGVGQLVGVPDAVLQILLVALDARLRQLGLVQLLAVTVVGFVQVLHVAEDVTQVTLRL